MKHLMISHGPLTCHSPVVGTHCCTTLFSSLLFFFFVCVPNLFVFPWFICFIILLVCHLFNKTFNQLTWHHTWVHSFTCVFVNTKDTPIVLYHPNVCSTLVKKKKTTTPKQTFLAIGLPSQWCLIHPTHSHLWDPVTLFFSLPTALTVWIKSTVTCVTTSPILLQT